MSGPAAIVRYLRRPLVSETVKEKPVCRWCKSANCTPKILELLPETALQVPSVKAGWLYLGKKAYP